MQIDGGMKLYFSGLLILLTVTAAPCNASDAHVDAPKIVRSPASIKCHAEADSTNLTGRAWQNALISCLRKNTVLHPHKALTKRCLADAEGKEGEAWKQSVLECIAPALEGSAKARLE